MNNFNSKNEEEGSNLLKKLVEHEMMLQKY